MVSRGWSSIQESISMTHINRLNKESTRSYRQMQKSTTQTLITINEKALKSLDIEGNLLYMIQNRHQKPQVDVILSGEERKAFL